MFTGIIGKIGTILQIKANLLEIEANNFFTNTKKGDSIAVNGLCLTIKEFNKNSAKFDLMEKTINSSTLKNIKVNDKVNLEKAATPATLLGGHIVQGHIDGTGTIKSIQKLEHSVLFVIKTTPTIIEQIVLNGSLAIDGVSLTIADIKSDTITASLIPTTLADTTFGTKRIGDMVNLETDVLGKYILKYLNKYQFKDKGLANLLTNSGFMD
ncbi:MAG: riboflavin synthase [Candidatus Margulisbacteria bacterium]|nr:riboflavin synthase [Candidatus Margulisiibacteriota bacterium]